MAATMRRPGIAWVLAACALVWAISPVRSSAAGGADAGFDRWTATTENRPAPTPAMRDAHGAETTLAAYRGRLVLVNFWATWCAPCIREMPALDALQRTIGSDGFVVLGVSQDRNGWPVMQPFLDRLALRSMTILHDPGGALGRAVVLKGLPTTILYGRDGIEIGRLVGDATWDGPAAVALIRKHLGP
ncbi:MAG: TlpA family protein disulfide reductase [Alphaproteobacteria bacterium]|nr:TlpA family protein disulfide reductase [Alphaproteobacteria bacterium]